MYNWRNRCWKIILLGALNLILGRRADLKLLKDSKMKCDVEAIFKITTIISKIFSDKNLDYDIIQL